MYGSYMAKYAHISVISFDFFIFWLSLLNIEEHLGNERNHVQWRSDGGGGGGGNDYGGGSDGGVGSSSGSIGIDMTMQQWATFDSKRYATALHIMHIEKHSL